MRELGRMHDVAGAMCAGFGDDVPVDLVLIRDHLGIAVAAAARFYDDGRGTVGSRTDQSGRALNR
jgi:hypothetical protein